MLATLNPASPTWRLARGSASGTAATPDCTRKKRDAAASIAQQRATSPSRLEARSRPLPNTLPPRCASVSRTRGRSSACRVARLPAGRSVRVCPDWHPLARTPIFRLGRVGADDGATSRVRPRHGSAAVATKPLSSSRLPGPPPLDQITPGFHAQDYSVPVFGTGRAIVSRKADCVLADTSCGTPGWSETRPPAARSALAAGDPTARLPSSD